MAKYLCFAKDKEGKSIQTIVETDSSGNLSAILKNKNLNLISAKELAKKKVVKKETKGRIKSTDISFLFRQLATMLDAGISLVDTLEELSAQSENITLSNLISGIRYDIEKGITFSQSLNKHPEIFPPIITALINAGEESGTLTTVCTEISTYLEDKIALQRDVKSATTYPLLVAGFFVFAVSFIMLFLIPKFNEIFKQFHIETPLLTTIVIKTSTFFLKNFFFILISTFILFFSALKYSRTQSGKLFFDKMKIKIPLIGKILHMTALSYFSQTFSILINSGVSITRSLEIVSKVSGNRLIEESTGKIKNGVIAGGTLSAEMRKYEVFPPLVTRMIAVGEESGSLGDMFSRVYSFYRDEAASRVKVLTSILEPVLLIGLAFVVGIVVIAIYLPIFKMSGGGKM